MGDENNRIIKFTEKELKIYLESFSVYLESCLKNGLTQSYTVDNLIENWIIHTKDKS